MQQKKLGFGLMRLPLLDASDQTSIDQELVASMANTFMDRGFTYFDTAYMYHAYKSEIALREAIVKRHPRDTFTVASKIPTMFLKEEGDQERIFDEQLEKCGVDYFDHYLIHNLSVPHYEIAKKFDTFAFVKQKKDEGFIKKMGFSFHDNANLLDEILTAHPEVDFVQLQINYLDWDDETVQSRKNYEVARKHGKDIIVMEPVKGGTLANVPADVAALFAAAHPDWSVASWAIRFAASLPGVMTVLSGMSTVEQLEDNTSYMENFTPLSPEDLETIKQATAIIKSAHLIPCTACRYCVEGCPVSIAIPEYFALYNTEKQILSTQDPDAEKSTSFMFQKMYYSNVSKSHGKASDCIECGACEDSCPQQIKIIDRLKEVAALFEGE